MSKRKVSGIVSLCELISHIKKEVAQSLTGDIHKIKEICIPFRIGAGEFLPNVHNVSH